MDARQKYTEANECIISEEFLESIRTFRKGVAINIGALLDKTIHQVDDNMELPQLWGGVVDNDGSDFYFSIEVWSQDDGENTAIIDIQEISLDDYLDLINSNRYLHERVDVCNQYD